MGLKAFIGISIPMLVAIRLAVMGIREAIVFFLKTGWRYGKFCLGIVLFFIVLFFQQLQLGPELKTYAIENMCATSFL